MSDQPIYGVWMYQNGDRCWLEGVHTDIDTLRQCSNQHQAELKSQGHKGSVMIFEEGSMKSEVYSYFNGEVIWQGWLQIEELPVFKQHLHYKDIK